MSITADIDGIWAPVWQRLLLDDSQAKRRGHTSTSLRAAPHGTYVQSKFYRIQTTDSDDGDIENAIVDVFDDRGNFIRFRWDETAGYWISSDEPITYTLPAGTYGYDKKRLPALTLTRYPTLALQVYTAADAPDPIYIGKYRPVSLGDATAAVTLPPQRLEFKGDEGHLEWKVEPWTSGKPLLVLRLGQPPLDPQRAITGHNLGQPFGQVFVTQSKLDQVSNSFAGFDPTLAGSYANKGIYVATSLGTFPQDTSKENPGQIFQGALLFSFPRQDSFDYVQCTFIDGSPNIPAGIYPQPVDTEDEDTHSSFISTTLDVAQANSVSIGLSAGVDKLLSVKSSFTYSGKTEAQNKNQSRFTVSRKVAKVWVAHLDVPSLSLHKTYLGGIMTRTYDLLADQTSDKTQSDGWGDDFVPTWGTHYASSITHGSMTLARTWFSLQNEERASENSVKVAESASLSFEGIKAGADVSVDQMWSSKTGFEMSEEDSEHFGIGTPDPVSIFLDLRPTSELLSPIFLPYDGTDEWGRFAPWVWTEVRGDFERWLTEQGLYQPIDPGLVEDYRPRRYTVQLKHLEFVTGPTFTLVKPEASGEWRISQLADADAPGAIEKDSPQDTAPAKPGDPLPIRLVNRKAVQFDLGQSILAAAGLPFAKQQFRTTNVFDEVTEDPQSEGRTWVAGNALNPVESVLDSVGCTIATSAGNVKPETQGGICFGLDAKLSLSEAGNGGAKKIVGAWDVRGHAIQIASEELPTQNGFFFDLQKVVDLDAVSDPFSVQIRARFTFQVAVAEPFED